MPSAAKGRGLKVIIAGAGGAAHLPGMTASMTPLPVLGVPVESAALKGQDSLLSIVQMPAGIPVGTLAIGRAGAINAALLAASIVGLGDAKIMAALERWRARQTAAVAKMPSDDATAPPLMTDAKTLPPGSTIGILGGGQLGRMTALAAARLGYRCIVYAPGRPTRSRRQVSAGHVQGAYDDTAALARFAAQVDVITYEFENVPEAAVAECQKLQAGPAGREADPLRPAPAAREGVLRASSASAPPTTSRSAATPTSRPPPPCPAS